MPKGQTKEARLARLEGLCCPIHGAGLGDCAPITAQDPWVYYIDCHRRGCEVVAGVWVYHGEPSRVEVIAGPEDVVGLAVETETPWDEPEAPYFDTRQIPVADGNIVRDVVEGRLCAEAIYVYAGLVTLCGECAVARRRIASVASTLGMAERILRDHLKALERLGWVETTRDGEGRDFLRIHQLRRTPEGVTHG